MPLDKYFIVKYELLCKVVQEDDKVFHVLVAPINFSEYILHQTYDAAGYNGTA